MSELLDKQFKFTLNVAKLILWAYDWGYRLTFSETYRTQEQAAIYAAQNKGIANSLHCDRLAVDFNAFKDGKLLSIVEDYKPLGDYWKSLSEPGFETAWGGDFVKIVDPIHFSIKHDGRA